MLIVGAGGFAKQLLEIFEQLGQLNKVMLFDDYTEPLRKSLYDLPILHSLGEVEQLFKHDNRFILGVGNPQKRYEISQKFSRLNGELTTLISPRTNISHINITIGKGVTILTNSIIENGVKIGEGCLINIGAYITHDVQIGEYTEISPGVKISGGCSVGRLCFLGTGSILIPKVQIGESSVVAAGAVVTENVPPGVMVAGVPAEIKKRLK
jgi:sugar O-acyltransferase (sialic acid O-acetyltransferase NeuD family)